VTGGLSRGIGFQPVPRSESEIAVDIVDLVDSVDLVDIVDLSVSSAPL